MRLTERLALSNQRWQCVLKKLPAVMHAAIKPGPIDEVGWTLLVDNGAVAAKLRHMVPVLEAELAAQGWPPLAIRIKVLAGA